MAPPLPSLDVQGLPQPGDPGQAALGLTRWRERAAESDDAGLAQASLRAALRFLLRVAHHSGELEIPQLEDPERESGVIVLGMGKLGARELNYSSDIDLIVLFDTDRVRYAGRTSVQQCFARLARDLVRILD